jgi:hypothetical protein
MLDVDISGVVIISQKGPTDFTRTPTKEV